MLLVAAGEVRRRQRLAVDRDQALVGAPRLVGRIDLEGAHRPDADLAQARDLHVAPLVVGVGLLQVVVEADRTAHLADELVRRRQRGLVEERPAPGPPRQRARRQERARARGRPAAPASACGAARAPTLADSITAETIAAPRPGPMEPL